MKSKLYTLTNKEREASKLAPLKFDNELTKLALARAKELYKQKQWSHDNWEKSFTTTKCENPKGENLARNFKSDEEAHKALMGSPTHKANVMKSAYTHMGVAKYKDINVQLFCKKK